VGSLILHVYVHMQVLTVKQLLNGQQIEYPHYTRDYNFKQAPSSRAAAETMDLSSDE